MRYAAAPRREIGIRTVFNILGPLTNPAGAEYQVLGVPSEELGDKIAAALCRMGTKRALVVHGTSGIDELSISGRSVLWEINNGCVTSSRQYICPEDVGLSSAAVSSVLGGTPQQNAEILRNILNGERSARRDVVLLNAAAGIYVGGMALSLSEAVATAATVIDSGKAAGKLDQLISFSRELV